MRSAPRFLVAILLLGVFLSGCGYATADSPVTSSVPSVSTTPPSVTTTSSVSKCETVILLPEDNPGAPDNETAQVFADHPNLTQALETALPAQVASATETCHPVVVISVGGASIDEDTATVYAQVFEEWWSIEGTQPVEMSASVCPTRIQLKRTGDAFTVSAIDQPQDGEGFSDSLDSLFPAWVRDAVSGDSRPLQEEMWEHVAVWAGAQLPADAFVTQPPSVYSDPHGHEPSSSAFEMLNPKYVSASVAPMGKPADGDIEPGPVSADGRFRLYYVIGAIDAQVAIEDTAKGIWLAVRAPGTVDLKVMDCPGFDPAWQGATLFVDFCTVHDPYDSTITHYEIDCDSVEVIRAVPMGPLSLNEPAS
jgi:hypothetical protein